MDRDGLAQLESQAQSGDPEAQLALGLALDAAGDLDRAAHWLRSAAATGHIAAKRTLAEFAFSRPGFPPREGVTYAVSAANDGDADAAHLTALLCATRMTARRDWGAALVYMQRAAELGHALARKELALLAGDRTLAAEAMNGAGPDIWKRLAQSVDLGAQLDTPSMRVLSGNPRIAAVENFLAPEHCDWLIERTRPNLSKAGTFDPQTGAARYENTRTNSAAHFDLVHMDLVFALMWERIGRATCLPNLTMEAPTVLHYDAGEIFDNHYDFLDPGAPGLGEMVRSAGQRVLTFLCYLNDDFEGGETDFPLIPLRYRGRKGDAVFFWNVTPDGLPDKRTLHAGLPPQRGEKWLFSQWVRPGRGAPRP